MKKIQSSVIMSHKISHTHSNISDLSDYIMNNTFIASNLLKTSMEECIFFSAYIFSPNMNLPGFFPWLSLLVQPFQTSLAFDPTYFYLI